MIVYIESPATLTKTSNTFAVEFTPSKDIANRECFLCVEQLASTAASADSALVVRSNFTQPLSAEFRGQGLASGPNSVIYIRDVAYPPNSPRVLVYIPDGPQNLVFTIDTSATAAFKLGMMVSLVAA